MRFWKGLGGVASAIWRADGAATAQRSVATSAALQRRFPRPKLPLNTERLSPAERIPVAVTDKPDPSRGVPLPDGGIQYHGFAYYPRFPGRAEEPVTPTKLHRVELIASLEGQPYWVKTICRQLGVHSGKNYRSRGGVTVVKNIPEVNALLYQVKHVVRLDPVTFPEGQPSPDDLDGWQLLEDGRVVRNATMRIQPVTTEYDQLKLSPATIKHRLRLRWIKPFDLDEKRTV